MTGTVEFLARPVTSEWGPTLATIAETMELVDRDQQQLYGQCGREQEL